MYRDSYMTASDWLSATIDKLNLCNDVRGDQSSVQSQLHKVEVRELCLVMSIIIAQSKGLLVSNYIQ